MQPLLRLTEEEKHWNSYYGERGKPRVLVRRYPFEVTINAAHPTGTMVFRTTRRSRVYGLTWSGDVFALRVQITSATGENYFVDPLHIPLVSGHSPHSTLNSGVAFFPPYPVPTTAPFAIPRSPAWELEIDPNWVLPSLKQLQFDYTLENPNDPALSGINAATYVVDMVVHVWEFPQWEGDPRT